MQIQELVGVKSELENRGDMDQVVQRLYDHGFQHLGRGMYGVVVTHPRLPYVLKLFDAQDTAYLQFVNMVQNSGENPHFPRFRGKPIKLTARTWAIRMEKLAPWEPNRASILDRGLQEIMMVQDEDQGADWIKIFDNPDSAEARRAVMMVLRKWPRLDQALAMLHEFASSHRVNWDLHYGNIMKRGSTPVITDPFAG